MGRGPRTKGMSAQSLLYGRRSLRTGAAAIEPEPKQVKIITDDDMLDNCHLLSLSPEGYPHGREIYLLAQTPVLGAPPTNKEYSASIGIEKLPGGDKQFIGWINYGPAGKGRSQGKIISEGVSFDGCASGVNQKLSSKQSAKARSVYSSPGGPFFLTRQQLLFNP